MSDDINRIQNEIIKQQEKALQLADEHIKALTELNELLNEEVQILKAGDAE